MKRKREEETSLQTAASVQRKQRKRQKGIKLEAESISFHPFIPKDLPERTLFALRDYYWKEFCQCYAGLSSEDQLSLGLSVYPHVNTLSQISHNLIEAYKIRKTTGAPEAAAEEEKQVNSIPEDTGEINLFDSAPTKPSDSGEIDLFAAESTQTDSKPADSGEIDLFADDGEIDLGLEAAPKKPPAAVQGSTRIVLKTTLPDRGLHKLQYHPEWRKWRYLSPRMYLYTKCNLRRLPNFQRVKDAVFAFEKSMNVSRETERILCVSGAKQQRDRVFMEECTEEEVAGLQEACPEGCPPKFWAQRYRLFSKFDDGCVVNSTEAWFSVTPEAISTKIAERCKPNMHVVDAFCGVGGNAIAFAKACRHVTAVDINPKAVEAAQVNATIYGVNNIEFLVGNFFDVAPKLQADIVFLGLPWGGVDYGQGIYNVEEMGSGLNLFEVAKVARGIARNMVFCLPKTCDYVHLSRLGKKFQCHYEIEQNLLYGKCKMWTVYVGNLWKKRGQQK